MTRQSSVAGNETVEILQKGRFFTNLDKGSHSDWVAQGTYETFRRGDLVASSDRELDMFYLLWRGRARLYRVSVGGHQVTLHTQHVGNALWLMAAGEPNQVISYLEALSNDTAILGLASRELEQLAFSQPLVAGEVIAALKYLLAEAYDRIEELAIQPLRVRLARTLARLAQQDMYHMVWETHDELGSLVGASREVVTREMRMLHTLGMIDSRMHRNGIKVLNPHELASI